MSDTTASLQRKIAGAKDLQSVVRSMKAIAASSIGQYEKSIESLSKYYHIVEIGLGVCLRDSESGSSTTKRDHNKGANVGGAIVFGSDQGLVGQFNSVVADYAIKEFANLPATPAIWAVGERVYEYLANAGLPLLGLFTAPNSVNGISPLVGRVLLEFDAHQTHSDDSELLLFYNRPTSGSIYIPVSKRLLPLDEQWRRHLVSLQWPTRSLPEVMGNGATTLRALTREYLFVSLFRACAESLTSENASRLIAMQRADKNIEELLDNLERTFQRFRQGRIDEELFDVISGFEALNDATR